MNGQDEYGRYYGFHLETIHRIMATRLHFIPVIAIELINCFWANKNPINSGNMLTVAAAIQTVHSVIP